MCLRRGRETLRRGASSEAIVESRYSAIAESEIRMTPRPTPTRCERKSPFFMSAYTVDSETFSRHAVCLTVCIFTSVVLCESASHSKLLNPKCSKLDAQLPRSAPLKECVIQLTSW